MNIYRHEFTRECPVDGATIVYSLEIRTEAVIPAEDVVAACAGGPTLHEHLADELFAKFAGWQQMRAFHGHVDIETIRP